MILNKSLYLSRKLEIMNEEKIKQIEKGISDLQEKLRELQEPEFELKVDKWYKDDKGYLFCYQISNNVYGFCGYNDWNNIDNWSWPSHLTSGLIEATNEEVEAALIAEANKRGFKKGVYINQSMLEYCSNSKTLIETNIFEYRTFGCLYKNTLMINGYVIFSKGKWAEIITEPKVVINGYDMKQDGDIISFGCAKFCRRFLTDLRKEMGYFNGFPSMNRKIKSITLDSGVEITVEELKLICDNIK